MFLYICQDLKSKIMLKKAILFILIVLGCSNSSQAQYEQFYKEFGIMAGPVFLKSDFGARGDFENFTKNSGFTVGGFYYLTFIENFPNIREKFKFRLEASYTSVNMKHYGKYVDNTSNSLFTRQLRAMEGKTTVGTFGVQVEFFPWRVDDYNRGGSPFTPYIAGGVQVNSYSSEVTSSLGKIGTPEATPAKYMSGAKTDQGVAGSLSASIGTRIKIADYHALIVEMRGQYYLSDWIDGLNPNNKVYKENKSNDWSTALTVGYVYYFN